MPVRFDRIRKAQELMSEQSIVGLMIMNHDDYRYFFGRDWSQPRAIIPWKGDPILVAFAAEEPEMRCYVGRADVRIFTHVGEQIKDVIDRFREIVMGVGLPPGAGRPKVGMQLWFDTPAFLVDMFRKVNPMVELVSSDSVMDPLRQIKEPEEIEFMRKAQRIAVLGMDRARQMLRPGVTAKEIAAETLYAMMKEGSERTSTPLYITFGIETCMLHGRLSQKPLEIGDLVVIDLTPQYEGYCANLARTFILDEPDADQKRLLDIYPRMIERTRRIMKPGVTVATMDQAGTDVCRENGLEQYHVDGISHGIGLRFEETPASTIIKPHRNLPIREGMTMTIGHTILAIPGVGGVRHEDVYRVTSGGGEVLAEYPMNPIIDQE